MPKLSSSHNEENLSHWYYHRLLGLRYSESPLDAADSLLETAKGLINDSNELDKLQRQKDTLSDYIIFRKFAHYLFNIDECARNKHILRVYKAYKAYQASVLPQASSKGQQHSQQNILEQDRSFTENDCKSEELSLSPSNVSYQSLASSSSSLVAIRPLIQEPQYRIEDEMQDFLNVLGIYKNTGAFISFTEIKQAYRKQALKFHPDKNPAARILAANKFKELGPAFEMLNYLLKKKNPFLEHFECKAFFEKTLTEINASLDKIELKGEHICQKYAAMDASLAGMDTKHAKMQNDIDALKTQKIRALLETIKYRQDSKTTLPQDYILGWREVLCDDGHLIRREFSKAERQLLKNTIWGNSIAAAGLSSSDEESEDNDIYISI